MLFNNIVLELAGIVELSKPFFTEGDSVGFLNTKPPKDEDNNAYCQVSEKRKTPMKRNIKIKLKIHISCHETLLRILIIFFLMAVREV